ncbi:MAG: HmuY family protein [Nitrospirota bacterium]
MKRTKKFWVWLSENLFLVGFIITLTPVAILVILYIVSPGPSEELLKERGNYIATLPNLEEVGENLVGPIIYTIEAKSLGDFKYFDFSRGSVVDIDLEAVDKSIEWDIGFHRVDIRLNGGEKRKGNGGVINMGEVEFDSVVSAPESGYKNMVIITKWFDYDTFSHNITPKKNVYVVRTADNKYAKIMMLSYYCNGRESGCITFKYIYQGDGSRYFRKRDLSQ